MVSANSSAPPLRESATSRFGIIRTPDWTLIPALPADLYKYKVPSDREETGAEMAGVITVASILRPQSRPFQNP